MTRLVSRHWLSSIAVLLISAVSASAQADSSGSAAGANRVVRDPQAALVLHAAVSAMGGSIAISGSRDSVAQGTMQIFLGRSPQTDRLIMETAGADYRYQNTSAGGTDTVVSGHGHPVAESHGKKIVLAPRAAWGNLSPHVISLYLYRESTDPSYSVVSGGAASVKGRSALVIMTSRPNGRDLKDPRVSVTAHKWFIDSITHVPLRVEYVVPSARDGGPDGLGALEFSDFRLVSGVLVPFQIAFYHNNKLESVITVTSVKFNVGVPPSDFEISGGGQ